MIGLFNLLPVLPLDGGKVLQCLLGYMIPYHRSIVSCALISMFFSLIIIALATYQLVKGQLPLNLFVIGLFLLISNWVSYRQIPFHFFRFLMSRGHQMSRLFVRGALAQPIVVEEHRRISAVLKLFMREKYHLIYVVNPQGRIQGVLPEQRLVNEYLDGKKPGSAVSELFM
ncbi:Stage IV sporulation protein FB [compost metagenome]